MYLLDTDTFSLAARGDRNVALRILATPYEQIFLSGIVVEEVLRGALLEIERGRTNRKAVDFGAVYGGLFALVRDLSAYQLLAYTNDAEQRFREIYTKAANVRGTGDWRIAAHALLTDSVVVTRNTEDYRRIQNYAPGLRFEDWSREP